MKINIASGNATSLRAKIGKLDNRKPARKREPKSEILGCNKKIIKAPDQVEKRRKKRDPQSRRKILEKKLKHCKATAIAKIAVSRNGVDVQFNKSALCQENTCPNSGSLSTTVTKAISSSDDLKKALSAAMQTSRFAEIISKAKADRAGLRQERENQRRLQSEEEEAARIREAEQLKKEAQFFKREREAAQIALEMMKTEAELDLEDNLMILKELEVLSGCSPSYVLHGYRPVMVLRGLKSGKIVNPLERLGLHIKEEFLEDDDETYF